MKIAMWLWDRTRIFQRLPAWLVYFCAIRVWAEATTGPYGDTNATAITMSEAIARFSRIHGLGGSGKDEHFDSNRNGPLIIPGARP